MGSGPTTRRRRRLHVLQVSFVLFALCAAGLVSAGVVSGAGPLAALSDSTTETSTESTETTTTDETTTDSTETTTTDTQSTGSTTTEASPLPTAPPTLVSDKDDYMPGETVTLTGENWAPAEVVHIVVNDDQGQSWSRSVDVAAGIDGTGSSRSIPRRRPDRSREGRRQRGLTGPSLLETQRRHQQVSRSVTRSSALATRPALEDRASLSKRTRLLEQVQRRAAAAPPVSPVVERSRSPFQ
jgi:hypothetical protein